MTKFFKDGGFKGRIIKVICFLLALTVIICIWQYLSEHFYPRIGVIPSPLKTLATVRSEMAKDSFFKAVFGTLSRSIISFVYAFVPAFILAALSHIFKPLKQFFNPFIAICRAMPTIALIFIIILIVGTEKLPLLIALLVVFPLVYENIYAAFENVDKSLLAMANVFKVGRLRQITGIYLPAILPYIFSSVIAGFGLNIKVVIAAEVMGLPSMSIGYLILVANQRMDFTISFAWLAIAVVLSYLCETVLKIISRFSMPYIYPDRKILKTYCKKAFHKVKGLVGAIKAKGGTGR
ncbi:MAG: ABC transporter permease subunit [Clostridiales bacterium]|jgi:NitT/TauT family transport system permease protein|nr:ABC transporter permease subunit [Clostridiales bacterium]